MIAIGTRLLDRFQLDGRVAIVTGASSGLGAAFAVGLAQAGAEVVISARRRDRLEEVAQAIEDVGGRGEVVEADVVDVDDCRRVVDETMRRFGRVDVLVNNAGTGAVAPATRESPSDFRHVLDVNLMGSYWMAQACGRVMESGSSIVNVGSVLGFTTAAIPMAGYVSSKAAIAGLTRELARQWSGRKGIRVNALAPGYFPSEMTDRWEPDYLAREVARAPLGRMGDPDELTLALIFLASEASSFVTGVTLPVDGGALVN